VFGLLGADEDSLTAALGWLLAQDAGLCADILKLVGVTRRRAQARLRGSGYAVSLQKRDDIGRRDVVIRLPDLEVVIEAKIGSGRPSAHQLVKYAAAHKDRPRLIVALTRDGLPESLHRTVKSTLRADDVELRSLQWYQVIDAAEGCLRRGHLPPVTEVFFREFSRFVRGDYQMRYYDAEAFIQDVNEENRRIFEEGWTYVCAPNAFAKPLYFAPCFTSGCPEPGVRSAARVLHVEYVETLYAADLVGQIARIIGALTEESISPTWQKLWETHWRLGTELVIKRAQRDRAEGKGWGATRLYFLDEPFPLLDKSLRKPANFRQIPRNYSRTIEELRLGRLTRPKTAETPLQSA
jgi:hypothetical protein